MNPAGPRRCARALLVLVGITACSSATQQPIASPAAPAAASARSAPPRSEADVQFMSGMIPHHAQVAIDLGLAFGFAQPAHGIDEVGLDAIEIVLGLGVHEAEDHVTIGPGVDVGNAPVVANDCHLSGMPFPARHIRIGSRGDRAGRDEQRKQRQGDREHVDYFR